MQQVFAYISAHWMEGAIWLLGIGWGYLIKKVTEYRTIKDGLLAIMHDRLYQLSRAGRQRHGHGTVHPRQGPAHP